MDFDDNPRKPTSAEGETRLEAALYDILSAGHRLMRQRRLAANPGELSWTQNSVLAWLDIEGPKTIADLARIEAVKPQSMGATMAGLEIEGLVERRAHPTDGRQVLFALTNAGDALRRTTGEIKRDWMRAIISNLNIDDAETLETAAALLRRLAVP